MRHGTYDGATVGTSCERYRPRLFSGLLLLILSAAHPQLNHKTAMPVPGLNRLSRLLRTLHGFGNARLLKLSHSASLHLTFVVGAFAKGLSRESFFPDPHDPQVKANNVAAHVNILET